MQFKTFRVPEVTPENRKLLAGAPEPFPIRRLQSEEVHFPNNVHGFRYFA